MTLSRRDQIAATALQGMLACFGVTPDKAKTAAQAVEYADALVVELDRRPDMTGPNPLPGEKP